MPEARLENVYNNFVYAAEELEEALSALRRGDLDEAKGRISAAYDDVDGARLYAEDLSSVAREDRLITALRRISSSAVSALGSILEGSDIEDDLWRLESEVKALTGEGCRVPGSALDSAVASVASCLRKAAEKLSHAVRKVGKCDAVSGSSPAAIKACAAWGVVADELARRNLYISDDKQYLWGYVSGDKVYIRLSARGSKAVVDLRRGSVTVDAYTEKENSFAKTLLERIGLSCEKKSGRITCSGVNSSNVVRIAEALAFVTSAYGRIFEPSEFWGREASVEMEVSFAEKTLREIEPQIDEVLKEWKL